MSKQISKILRKKTDAEKAAIFLTESTYLNILFDKNEISRYVRLSEYMKIKELEKFKLTGFVEDVISRRIIKNKENTIQQLNDFEKHTRIVIKDKW